MASTRDSENRNAPIRVSGIGAFAKLILAATYVPIAQLRDSIIVSVWRRWKLGFLLKSKGPERDRSGPLLS